MSAQIFNGREDVTRPKYHILGALILIQFGVSLLIYMKEKYGILRKLNLQIEDLSSQEGDQDRKDELLDHNKTLNHILNTEIEHEVTKGEVRVPYNPLQIFICH